jgi:hypothetical protein
VGKGFSRKGGSEKGFIVTRKEGMPVLSAWEIPGWHYEASLRRLGTWRGGERIPAEGRVREGILGPATGIGCGVEPP